jgi:hypothetical protein
VVLFLRGWYRGWEEKAPRPMEFDLCSLHVASSNRPKFKYLYSVLYVLGVIRTLGGVGRKALSYLYYISSLCSGGFAVCDCMCWFGVCWGHGTDMPRTGMCTAGFGTSTRLLLRVAGRWRSNVPQVPHQGAAVVFGYTYVTCECYTPNIYIGA